MPNHSTTWFLASTQQVKQVYANDRDTGENAKVEYRITSDPSGLFSINRHNGWVTAARPIFGVSADDNGITKY